MKKEKNNMWKFVTGVSACFAVLLCSCNHISAVTSDDYQVVDNVLCFDNAGTFLKMLTGSDSENLGVNASGKSRSVADSDFVSMMDVIPDVDSFKTIDDFNEFISKYPQVLCDASYTNSEGETVSVYNLPVSPQLATLVNPDGLISVEGKIYNVLDEAQLGELEEVCENTSEARFVCSTFDGLTIAIPLFRNASAGPQYSVTDFTTTINGRRVVVQLWKGYCPLVLVAGGVGAEIGLYNPLPFCSWIWFPDFTHPVNMSYSLIYKKTGAKYLSMSNHTWWLNGWKVYESWPSFWGNDYTLKYTINGVTRSW